MKRRPESMILNSTDIVCNYNKAMNSRYVSRAICTYAKAYVYNDIYCRVNQTCSTVTGNILYFLLDS